MGLLATGLVAVAAAAPAQQPPITGRLSVSGYTVIALAADGHATSVVARGGRFAIRPPAARVTLQLRAPDGTYGGPVVVGRAGSHVIVGVRARAPLGRIAFTPALGYATARRVAPRWTDPTRWARARGGDEPFGARNLGRALAALPKHPPPGDRDADGIPDVIDVDDDGDLVLDDADLQAQPEALRAVSQLSELGSAADPPATQPANAHAGMPRAAIDAALVQAGTLTISSSIAGQLDCSGLAWCVAGAGALLQPHATSDQLRPGDVLMMRGADAQVAGAVGAVYATVPAIASYTDELGTTQGLNYPLDPATQIALPDGPDDDADVSVRLTFWRPQRRAMPADEVASDEGPWIDMGGLVMSARAAGASEPCPADAYSEPDRALLPFGPALLDLSPDVPASEGTTFSYTLDVTRCLAAAGQAFAPGDRAGLVFAASGAQSGYAFVHQPDGP